MDPLLSAVCINGVSKKLDQSSVYKPKVKYDKDQFQFGCDGPVIPRSSPAQVSQILDAVAAIPKGALEKGIKADWADSKAEMFESPKESLDYVKGWIKVLKTVKKAKMGLAIDVLT